MILVPQLPEFFDGYLTVVHKGTKVLDEVDADGLTAIANNCDEAEPGPFIVQGGHSYVEIKSFVVTPLVK